MYSWVTVPRATVGFHRKATWLRNLVGSRYRYGFVFAVMTPGRTASIGT